MLILKRLKIITMCDESSDLICCCFCRLIYHYEYIGWKVNDRSKLRWKCTPVDNLSISSGDKGKREIYIAYNSFSDIDNKNNENKRWTEQRRITMVMNGSSPLLG